MSKLNYNNKIILAPMVRMGTLPFRLLALEYGANIVYSEEIVDKRMTRTRKVTNDILGTIDFVDEYDGSVVFRTCKQERNSVVFQVGTNDAEQALKVAKLVEQDVAGFDVNMGCPKEFSIKGGMGAALLTQPEKVKGILCLLSSNLSIPVTCKIRLLSNFDDTLQLCKLIENCGVAAIAIHGRRKEERPQHRNDNDTIRRIAEHLTIPVIANGGSREIHSYEDIIKFWEETKASSVMIARAAQWNCSIFSPNGISSLDNVITNYLKYAIDYDNVFTNTKYCIQMMLRELQETPKGRRLVESKTVEEICQIWGMENYLQQQRRNFIEKSATLKVNLPNKGEVEPLSKRLKLEETFYKQVQENKDIIKCSIRFNKNNYKVHNFPKTQLLEYTKKIKLKIPVYRTEQVDKLFYSTVLIDGKEYANDYLEKNKRNSEQAAALACLSSLKLITTKI